jgi:hypothetical protein
MFYNCKYPQLLIFKSSLSQNDQVLQCSPLFHLCKVDDAINIRLEETIVMSFCLSVHSQNVLLAFFLLSLRVCLTMNRTGVAAFNQMVSIIGLFVSILYISFGILFSLNISFGMLLSRTDDTLPSQPFT